MSVSERSLSGTTAATIPACAWRRLSHLFALVVASSVITLVHASTRCCVGEGDLRPEALDNLAVATEHISKDDPIAAARLAHRVFETRAPISSALFRV